MVEAAYGRAVTRDARLTRVERQAAVLAARQVGRRRRGGGTVSGVDGGAMSIVVNAITRPPEPTVRYVPVERRPGGEWRQVGW